MEQRAEDVAAATTRREAAEEELRRLEAELRARRERLEGAVADSGRALEGRGLRAAELCQVEAFRAAEEEALRVQSRHLAESEGVVRSLRAEEELCRAALGRARAEEKVLERHQARVAEEERHRAEGRAEEAQAEAHQAGARRRSPLGGMGP